MTQPNENIHLPQLEGTPRRSFYTGGDMARALTIADLRARTHKMMPRFVLEYLEGGAEDEASLARERQCYAEWRFIPRQLVDVSHRSIETEILGKPAAMPLAIAPPGSTHCSCITPTVYWHRLPLGPEYPIFRAPCPMTQWRRSPPRRPG